MRFAFWRKKRSGEIDPEDIFLDAKNLPLFETNRLEGRIEQPIGRRILFVTGALVFLVMVLFGTRLFFVQIIQGDDFKDRSGNNYLRHTTLFAERGRILDRNGVELGYNVWSTSTTEFPERHYATSSGNSHLVGYVSYPAKDNAGFYYSTKFTGEDGIEKQYDGELSGTNGERILEVDARGNIFSENVVREPERGKDISLAVDSRLNERLTAYMKSLALDRGFTGGAVSIMDIHTGEIVAFTSFPEYNQEVITNRSDQKAVNALLKDTAGKPFLNRLVGGLYTPGSIVKPFISVAALSEKIISPLTPILSTGSITVKSQYDPSIKSVFTDWKAHGEVDMRQAIAVSSNVYFYTIGGGFGGQRGLGIRNIEKYMRIFGFGSSTGSGVFETENGTIPNPEWKARVFDGEPWRLGDTYFTAIGQYGFQVAPLQALRAIASIANNGVLREPVFVQGEKGESTKLPLSSTDLQVAREGMRRAVLVGTAKGLNLDQIHIAAKTGTAELDAGKKYVNSWVVGFFPYERPRYAFTAVMERGPHDNTVGALFVMRQFFDWMKTEATEYYK